MTSRLAAVLLIVLAVGATTAVIVLGRGGGEAVARDPAPATAAEVTRQDLAETRTATGIVGYGPETSLDTRAAGTITALPAPDVTIRRGGELYEVDRIPTILLYGRLPAYRTLRPGMKGSDARQLDANLRALGYGGFTARAVRKWQRSLGLEETGVVELGRVVFLPDAVRVNDHRAQPGSAVHPGTPLLTVTGTAHVVTVRLDETDAPLAKVGATATVRTPDGGQVQGRVATTRFVVNTSQSGTTTKLELTVAIGTGGYDRAAVDVTLTAAARRGVLTVPIAALLALPGGGYGVELMDGRVVPVQTGLFAGGLVEVSGRGLAPGLRVGMPT